MQPYNYSSYGRTVKWANENTIFIAGLYAIAMAAFITLMAKSYINPFHKMVLGFSFLGAHLLAAIAYLPCKKEFENQQIHAEQNQTIDLGPETRLTRIYKDQTFIDECEMVDSAVNALFSEKRVATMEYQDEIGPLRKAFHPIMKGIFKGLIDIPFYALRCQHKGTKQHCLITIYPKNRLTTGSTEWVVGSHERYQHIFSSLNPELIKTSIIVTAAETNSAEINVLKALINDTHPHYELF